MIVTNESEFREAIQEMIAKRNGYRRNRARKYYIKTLETDELIVVGGYFRIHIQLGEERPFKEAWCYNIIWNKQNNTLLLNDDNTIFKEFEKTDFSSIDASAIGEWGESVQAVYSLDSVREMCFVHF